MDISVGKITRGGELEKSWGLSAFWTSDLFDNLPIGLIGKLEDYENEKNS
jgi:hypothetical protein